MMNGQKMNGQKMNGRKSCYFQLMSYYYQQLTMPKH